MLKKRIIPVLLLRKGRLVKPIKFDKYRDVGDPVSQAKIYDAQLADELIFLDMDATSEKRFDTVDIIRKVAKECFMPLTVGGGIRSLEDINTLLKAGADKISINSIAVENPDFIREASERFGSQCIVVSIDVKKTAKGYEVFTQNGKKATRLEAVEWAKRTAGLGAGEILITSIDNEGTSEGYDLNITKAICDAVNIPVIAHGGAGTLEDFYDAFEKAGASAVAAGSLFCFTDQSLIKTRRYLKVHEVSVRTG